MLNSIGIFVESFCVKNGNLIKKLFYAKTNFKYFLSLNISTAGKNWTVEQNLLKIPFKIFWKYKVVNNEAITFLKMPFQIFWKYKVLNKSIGLFHFISVKWCAR